MSGFENQVRGESMQPAHVVVRCSGISEDGRCGREQLIEAHDDGVRGLSAISDETAEWLTSFGWRHRDRSWLCPFCSKTSGGLL